MYEDAIRNLRICQDGEHCDRCEFYGQKMANGLNACTEALCKQAADAIEELSTLLDGVEADNDGLCETIERLKKPRWIPVTEPPKEGEPVFVHIPCRYRKQESIPMIAFWEQGQWKEYESHRSVYNITHWRQLPEPPKGE